MHKSAPAPAPRKLRSTSTPHSANRPDQIAYSLVTFIRQGRAGYEQAVASLPLYFSKMPLQGDTKTKNTILRFILQDGVNNTKVIDSKLQNVDDVMGLRYERVLLLLNAGADVNLFDHTDPHAPTILHFLATSTELSDPRLYKLLCENAHMVKYEGGLGEHKKCSTIYLPNNSGFSPFTIAAMGIKFHFFDTLLQYITNSPPPAAQLINVTPDAASAAKVILRDQSARLALINMLEISIQPPQGGPSAAAPASPVKKSSVHWERILVLIKLILSQPGQEPRDAAESKVLNDTWNLAIDTGADDEIVLVLYAHLQTVIRDKNLLDDLIPRGGAFLVQLLASVNLVSPDKVFEAALALEDSKAMVAALVHGLDLNRTFQKIDIHFKQKGPKCATYVDSFIREAISVITPTPDAKEDEPKIIAENSPAGEENQIWVQALLFAAENKHMYLLERCIKVLGKNFPLAPLHAAKLGMPDADGDSILDAVSKGRKVDVEVLDFLRAHGVPSKHPFVVNEHQFLVLPDPNGFVTLPSRGDMRTNISPRKYSLSGRGEQKGSPAQGYLDIAQILREREQSEKDQAEQKKKAKLKSFDSILESQIITLLAVYSCGKNGHILAEAEQVAVKELSDLSQDLSVKKIRHYAKKAVSIIEDKFKQQFIKSQVDRIKLFKKSAEISSGESFKKLLQEVIETIREAYKDQILRLTPKGIEAFAIYISEIIVDTIAMNYAMVIKAHKWAPPTRLNFQELAYLGVSTAQGAGVTNDLPVDTLDPLTKWTAGKLVCGCGLRDGETIYKPAGEDFGSRTLLPGEFDRLQAEEKHLVQSQAKKANPHAMLAHPSASASSSSSAAASSRTPLLQNVADDSAAEEKAPSGKNCCVIL